MTRIAIASDSHGHKEKLERFADYCQSADVQRVFHLGDLAEDAKWLSRRLKMPVDFVAGNCDFFSDAPREARIEVEGRRFLLLHGDKMGVKYGYDRLSYYTEANHMDAALFGHTHTSFAGYVGGALLINPGALRDGRFCLLEVTARDIIPRIMNLE